jgi:hypothetical protein
MSDSSSAGEGKMKSGRVSKFKGMLKRRGKQFPMMLLLIVVLSIAMVYSLITTVMM